MCIEDIEGQIEIKYYFSCHEDFDVEFAKLFLASLSSDRWHFLLVRTKNSGEFSMMSCQETSSVR